MRKMKRGIYHPRSIDRAIFGILGALHLCSGIYLIGPWYLNETESGKAPLFAMFNSETAVSAYGVMLLLTALALLYATVGRGVYFTKILSAALLTAFLTRLYSLIGVFLTVESWRPPSYLSHAATVVILGSYWVWVRTCARVTK